MEQKDYLLREIEKIGAVLRAIAGMLFGRKDEAPAEVRNPFAQLRELLREEVNFELEAFLQPDEQEPRSYVSRFKGFNSENLELLAGILVETAAGEPPERRREILVKALLLYELCTDADKTFSATRESRITEIRARLAAELSGGITNRT